jgi:ATP-binding cassette subfamily C protein CydD
MNALKQLLRQTPHAKPALAWVTVLGALGAVCTGAQWWLLARAVNLAVYGRAELGALLQPLLLAALAVGFRAALLGWREAVSSRLGIRAVQHWRDAATRAALLSTRMHGAQGDASLIAHGVDKLEGYFARFLPSAALMAAVPGVLLAFAFAVDPLTGAILLVTAPLVPLLMWLIGVAAREHAAAQFSAMQRLGARFADTLRGFEDLSAMNRLGGQRLHIAASSRDWRAATMGVLRVAFLNGFALEITATIATAIVAVSSGLRLLNAQLPFEVALLGILIAPEFYAPLRQFGLEHHAGMEAEPVAAAVLGVLDEEARQTEQPQPAPGPVQRLQAAPRAAALEGVNLSYCYADAALPALEDVALTLPTGSRTALVGVSGSGKSTLVRLLLRLVDPTGGELRLNGVPASALSRDAWLASFAWVGQGVHLFHRSVAENLRLARPEATDADLWAALEAAQAAEFVAALPAGLDTVVGERGARLSGGEAQRVAIARALLKDAPVLILDEATSSLDAFTQSRVQLALDDLMKGRTVLTVAHRLETVRAADQIVVLERGRVKECGTHAQLVARGDAYARLLRAGVTP